jgi:hypothetical protein
MKGGFLMKSHSRLLRKKSLSRLMHKKRKFRIAKAANIQNRGRFCFHGRGNRRRKLKAEVRRQLRARPWLRVRI